MKDLVKYGDNEPVTTSMLIAEALGIEHRAIRKMVNKYGVEFARLGNIQLERIKVESEVGGRPWEIAYMNESHVMFLFSLMRNTEKFVDVTLQFIESFKSAKNCLNEFIGALKTFDFDDVDVRYVYAAMDAQGRVKIGISNNPERRIKELNIGNADTLKLIFRKEAKGNGYSDETSLHNTAGQYHIRSEWFAPETATLLMEVA